MDGTTAMPRRYKGRGGRQEASREVSETCAPASALASEDTVEGAGGVRGWRGGKGAARGTRGGDHAAEAGKTETSEPSARILETGFSWSRNFHCGP